MYRNSIVVANYFRQVGRAACHGFESWHPRYSAQLTDPWTRYSVDPWTRYSVDPWVRHFRVGSEHLQAGNAPEKSPCVSSTGIALLPPTKGRQKPRVVILGSGWGACRLLKDINTLVYDVVCVSPRNHMVFTPLLASTCVGTLEFRSVAEPVRKIQPALSLAPDSFYLPARCTAIDPEKHEVCCILCTIKKRIL